MYNNRPLRELRLGNPSKVPEKGSTLFELVPDTPVPAITLLGGKPWTTYGPFRKSSCGQLLH